MEIIPSGIISSISNSLCSYCLEHLKRYQQLVHLIYIRALYYALLHVILSAVYMKHLAVTLVW